MTMQSSLGFESPEALPEIISLAGAELLVLKHFIPQPDADRLFQDLLALTPWRQDHLNFAGKRVLVPRLQAWYGDQASHYAYSGLRLTPLPWSPLLLQLKTRVERAAAAEFNAVLINLYRDGNDSVAWHSDDERELGPRPLVASLSLGASRRFELKPRPGKTGTLQHCELDHGTLLIMGAGLQEHWQHRVPKQPAVREPRINLTFRHVAGHGGTALSRAP